MARHLCVYVVLFGPVKWQFLNFYNVDYLEKVDKSHFHVLQIPDGCTNLSNLTHQVIPGYDMESGYLYHEYAEGESVDPNERILVYNKVKKASLLKFFQRSVVGWVSNVYLSNCEWWYTSQIVILMIVNCQVRKPLLIVARD